MTKGVLNGHTNGHFIEAAHGVGARQSASNQNSRAGAFTDIFEAHRLENISDANRFELVSGLLEDIAEVRRAEANNEVFIIKAKDEATFKLAKKLVAAFFEEYRDVKQDKDIKKKHYLDELSKRIKKLRKAEGLNSRYEIDIPGFLRGVVPQPRKALSPGQTPYIDALADKGVNVVVTLGNFGSGKTFLTVAQALEDIIAGRKSKLVATRKESGVHKKIGAVPGSQHDKTKRDNHAIFEKIVEVFKIWGLSEKDAIEKTELLIKPSKGLLPGQEIVEIVLPDQLEGRTIHNATIILDEAHGVTTAMMRGILGRLGDNSRLVIMGDFRQINNKQLRQTDYNEDDGCGLAYAVALLAKSPNLDKIAMIVNMGPEDVHRSAATREIAIAMDAYAEEHNLFPVWQPKIDEALRGYLATKAKQHVNGANGYAKPHLPLAAAKGQRGQQQRRDVG